MSTYSLEAFKPAPPEGQPLSHEAAACLCETCTYPAEAVQQFRKQLNQDKEPKLAVCPGGWGWMVGLVLPCSQTTLVFLSGVCLATQTLL